MLHAIMLIDESGSMFDVKKDVEGGYKEYLKTLRKQDGEVKLSLFTFDLRGPFVSYGEIHDSILHEKFVEKDLTDVKAPKAGWFSPHGSTPLNDAVLILIKKMKGIIPKGDDVTVIIYTDGQENASRHSSEEVKAKIKKMESKGWDFVYLGANQDAWNAGMGIGVSGLKLNTSASGQGTQSMLASAANMTNTARRASAQGVYSVGDGGTLASVYEGKDIGEKPIEEDDPKDAA